MAFHLLQPPYRELLSPPLLCFVETLFLYEVYLRFPHSRINCFNLPLVYRLFGFSHYDYIGELAAGVS